MTDFTASQTQPSAERARSLRQTILVDADQRRCVVRHDGHPLLDDRAAMAFVGEAPCSPTQQTGNDAFDHRSAISTGVGEVHLGWGRFAGQARFVQDPEELVRRWATGAGDRPSAGSHGENPLWCNASRREASLNARSPASEWMAGLGYDATPRDRLLHLVDQGLHIPGITGIPHRQMQGKDKARRRLGDNPRLSAKLGGAVAFAFANGRNRGIVGVDDFAVGHRFALRQPSGLVFDPLVGLESSRELGAQARRAAPPTAASCGASAPARPERGAGLGVHTPTVGSRFGVPV